VTTPIDLQVEDGGDRLDLWLSDQLPDLSRSRLQKLIAEGQVLRNGEPCTSKKLILQDNDRIQLSLPEAQPLAVEPEAIDLDILYEDESLIIVNKAAGMVVHPAPGHYSGTLVNALLHHCQDLAGIGGVLRPGIVHRLDKDTTGAIVVAKTDQVMLDLQSQIQAKTAQREYLGIVYGVPKTESGMIDQPIGRHPVDRKRMAVVPVEKGGRDSVTYWEIRERIGHYTLVQFRLGTGRTHQIRVHSAFLGHPVVGDLDYSMGRSLGVKLTGQALHAWRLTLRHPVTGETIEAIAPPPESFEKLLRILRVRLMS
jgi:23S rRNA pseudouridine1911/1915/1917 synthase